MMHPTLSAPPMIDAIAVTYRCSHGHHDIRFYKNAPVTREVVCSICGAIAVISPEEYARHAQLSTSLGSWMM